MSTRTDLLAVSLPALDLVGHEFGWRSHEVQDVMARADRQIGRLLDALDRQVGRGRYVLAFTSDHGLAPTPEQAALDQVDAGRVSSTEVRTVVDAALTTLFGESKTPYAVAAFDNQVGLAPGVMDRLRETPGGIEAVKAAMRGVKGIEHVYSADDITRGGQTTDHVLRMWRLSYVADRGGDFAYTPRLHWVVRSTSGSTHGTPHAYDQQVPLVLFGAGIQPGRYDTAATPADIAPTLATLTGVTMPNVDGRVLVEALVSR